MPPDVRRGYASPAGRFMDYGLRPSFGLCPMAKGRTEGTALILFFADGEAEPRLTSGGTAVISMRHQRSRYFDATISEARTPSMSEKSFE